MGLRIVLLTRHVIDTFAAAAYVALNAAGSTLLSSGFWSTPSTPLPGWYRICVLPQPSLLALGFEFRGLVLTTLLLGLLVRVVAIPPSHPSGEQREAHVEGVCGELIVMPGLVFEIVLGNVAAMCSC